jgi:hypothetical protein
MWNFVKVINFNEQRIPSVEDILCFQSAEEGGFEPPVPLRVRQFSKLVVSATHPSFRSAANSRFAVQR